jgi:hypothetical protein
MWKIPRLNWRVFAAYSPARIEKGECRGEQGAEADEPGSQETQAEEEGRQTSGG